MILRVIFIVRIFSVLTRKNGKRRITCEMVATVWQIIDCGVLFNPLWGSSENRRPVKKHFILLDLVSLVPLVQWYQRRLQLSELAGGAAVDKGVAFTPTPGPACLPYLSLAPSTIQELQVSS
jgi:hypothetical protein